MQTYTLIQRLVSHIPMINLYPTKHKKVESKPLNYIHVSQVEKLVKNKSGEIIPILVGVTYHKPIEE